LKRLFVSIPSFDKRWKDALLSDDDLSQLQNEILNTPNLGAVMQGCEGLRKMRFAKSGMGKSGGIRICYLDMPEICVVFLITLFKKNEQENLTQGEVNEIAKVIRSIKQNALTTYARRK